MLGDDAASLLGDAKVEAVVRRLQSTSADQDSALVGYFTERMRARDLNWEHLDADAHHFLADKLVALDADKALLCHRLCLAMRAKRVVEVGTSHGLSTLYLAAAVRAVANDDGRPGVVIGTEYEPGKVAAARANFVAAGLEDHIELRQGDLRDTLRDIGGSVDLALVDIWTEMARPALELIAPHLRSGAIVIADNTMQFADSYRDYFDFIADPANGLVTQTLPFPGGLEMTVKP